jgi:ferric-dicitrate binding protein FerR (iron transport regulator)
MDIDELIYKQLTNTATTEEQQQLAQWRSQSSTNEEVYQQLSSHWKGEHRRIVQLKEVAWAELQRKMWVIEQPPHQVHKFTGKANFWRYSMSVAAAVALLLAATAWWYWPVVSEDNAPVASVQQILKETALGQKLSLVLPDGSRVKLNAGSQLSFPQVFAGKQREVTLDGEAFFDVAHDPEHPFVVHSKGIAIEVKGTSFNVENYSHNKQNIAVVTGLVLVSNPLGAVLVEPGEMAMGNSSSLKKNAYSPGSIAWKEDILVFEQADMQTFAKKINYWYGFQLNEIGEIHIGKGFTGVYENPTLKTVMQSFSFATGARYSIDYSTKTVTIW